MKKSYLRRLAAVLLSVMVFAVFSFVSLAEVNAASKTKTFYVPSKETTTTTETEDGKTSTEKSTTTYTYGKNGLCTSIKYSKGGKYKFVRNKKGYITQEKKYNESGKLSYLTVYTLKSNGDVSKEKDYAYSSGKKKLDYTTTYEYWKKGVLKKRTSKSSYYSNTSNYNKKGHITKSVSSGKSGDYKWTDTNTYKNTFNKKGDITKQVVTTTSKDSYSTTKSTTTNTYDYSYNSKGKPTKIISKSVTKENGKTKYTSNDTTTYKYNKRGDVVKSVSIHTFKSGTYESKYKTTTTTTYKKVKKAKKYWNIW